MMLTTGNLSFDISVDIYPDNTLLSAVTCMCKCDRQGRSLKHPMDLLSLELFQ